MRRLLCFKFQGAKFPIRAWSVSIGRLPNFSKETILMAKPAIEEHIEKSAWVPYTDDGNIRDDRFKGER